MMSILDEILAHKRIEVASSSQARPIDAVRARALVRPPARSFAARLKAPPGGPARLIAEIKRKSPSAGTMATITDPVDLARTYVANGAVAISVLTDARHFGGSLDDLSAVRAAVSVPVLRKDFLFTEYQVWEARAAGADAVLLIVAVLASPLGNPDLRELQPAPGPADLNAARDRLGQLMRIARKAGLEVLVEVRDEGEASIALELKAPVVGINNRSLATFVTTLETTEDVARTIQSTAGSLPVIVSESGLHDALAVARVRGSGVDAVLVGEALVRSGDPAAKVREMAGAGAA